MKRCAECMRDYYDDSLLYCLDDGSSLLEGPGSIDGPVTAIMNSDVTDADGATRTFESAPHAGATAILPASSGNSGTQTALRKSSMIAGIVGVLLVSLLGIGSYLYYGRAASRQIESIAVMPFKNESGNADNEYLSDGMTESLISSLSQLPNLNVKARSSVFRYKGKDSDPKTIGKELGVQAVLNGRVVQRGDQLTLSLELIDAATENVIWSDKYDRKQTDLVSLQSEIARDVSGKLKIKLSGTDEQKLTKNSTANPEANKLYLQGRFYAGKRTAKDVQKAIELFRQAVALDPNYALAYAGLADTYLFLTIYGDTPASETFPKARETAMKAVELDGTLAEPNSTLGLILFLQDHDFAGWERLTKRAIELDPNSMDAHRRNGLRLLWLGKFDESLVEFRRAMEIEPLSSTASQNYAMYLFYAGSLDESEAQLKKTLELDNGIWFPHFYLFHVYRRKENYPLAVEELAKAQEIRVGPEAAKAIRENFASGSWKDFLLKVTSDRERAKLSPYMLAFLYADLGDNDKAFGALNETFEKKDQFIGQLKIDPFPDSLRRDPRFADLLKKAGFPQ